MLKCTDTGAIMWKLLVNGAIVEILKITDWIIVARVESD